MSVLKSASIGFTHFIVREPSPILVLMPTESDARGLMVDGGGVQYVGYKRTLRSLN